MSEQPKTTEVLDSHREIRTAENRDLDDVTSKLARPFTVVGDNDGRNAERADPETEDTLKPGTLLNDRYEIVELVHSGGMGHVYKAIDRQRQSESRSLGYVAIKMLRNALSENNDYQNVLEREAAKARSLSHPNIIDVLDFDKHDDRFFLVMEWLEGESVSALLRRTDGQRLSPAFAWTVIEGAAAAIHHAHLNDVVHADINPSNIFITTTHDIKLLDFGVARCASDRHDTGDEEATWVTQPYASPEVLSGLTPDFQDDIFSFGCVAYRLLGDDHPFAGSPPITAQRDGVVVKPIPGLPDSDWQILKRALAYSGSERPDTVEVFLRNQAPAVAVSVDEPKRTNSFLNWRLLAAATVVAAVAIGWWFRPAVPVLQEVAESVQETATDLIPVTPQPETTAPAETPLVETLLSAAQEAVLEQRLILPEGDNAREWYREALTVEPENPEALRGLRSISDAFIERANSALKAGNPQAAAAELTIASETDPGNPAIRMVTELLIAQGDAELAAARMAAASGNIEQANAALARAEQYTHIETATLDAVREQLDGAALEASFLNSLAAVDQHMATGRLLEPDGNNARDALARLADRYGDDPRLTAAYERFAGQLLTKAAFATAAGSFVEAVSLIDEAASLEVLDADVKFAYERLASATALRSTPPQAADDVSERESVNEAEREQTVSESASGSGTAPPTIRRLTVTRLEDLGLERFIAPAYPRRAQRRGLTGFAEVAFNVNPNGATSDIAVLRGVPDEVFDESAMDAVRKWRFAPRQDTVRASVRLRFEIAE